MADMESELDWFTSPDGGGYTGINDEPAPRHVSSTPLGVSQPLPSSTPATSVQYQQQYQYAQPQATSYQQAPATVLQPQQTYQQPSAQAALPYIQGQSYPPQMMQQHTLQQPTLYQAPDEYGNLRYYHMTPQGQYIPAYQDNTSSPSPVVHTHLSATAQKRGPTKRQQAYIDDEYDDEGIDWDQVPDERYHKQSSSSHRQDRKLERRDKEIKNLKQKLEDKEKDDMRKELETMRAKMLQMEQGLVSTANFANNQTGAGYDPQSAAAGPSRSANQQAYGNTNNSFPTAPVSGSVVPPITNKRSITLKPVTVIPDQQRSIFKFPVFNAVQSKCFPILYESDDNMVASAPTGAGKTVLFEISILKLLRRDKEAKIVYIAPTKSLCSERVRDWKAKFNSFGGIKVAELTGDTSATAINEAKAARLIVTTPEKWDSVTRKAKSGNNWYRAVQLFCIDEVHLLAEERGATLEVIVSRMKSLDTDYLRFVAVSATVPNIEDVATWIGLGKHAPHDENGREPMAHVMKFGDEFRPCPLQKIVYGYPAGTKGSHAFDSTLNYKLLELIVKHSSGKPALVFCNTRKGCVAAATQIGKDYDAANHSKHAPPWPKPVKHKVAFDDPELQKLAVNGIGVHSGGIAMHDRRLTEELYLNGHLRVICTTSTLAVGVNLPARMVIIKNTKLWDANQGKEIDYTDLDILQMMGRAGRPQFDDSGVAVIMCKMDDKDKYEAMANSQTVLESCLHKTLVEHINSEIVTGTINNISEAFKWLRNSFLYVRIRRNPEFYRAVVEDLAEGDGQVVSAQVAVDPEKRLEEMVLQAIKRLTTEGLADQDEDDAISATRYGDMLCSYSIRFPTFLHLMSLPKKASKAVLLEYISQATEFKDIRYRAGEKASYAEYNKRDEIRFPLAQVAEPCDKVNILLQLQLSGVDMFKIKTDNANPGMEIGMVMQHAGRITNCLVDLATQKEDGAMSKNAIEISRCIRVKSWEHSPAFLTQIEGVGVAYSKKLWDLGLKTLQDFNNIDSGMITMSVGRQGNFGGQLKSYVKRLPELKASVKITGETVEENGVKVKFTAKVQLMNGNLDRLISTKGAVKWAISILLTTTDGQFISYDRLTIEKLKKLQNNEREMDKTFILTRPSQKIEIQATCDHFVGIGCSAYATPKTPSSSYPIPKFRSASEESDIEMANIDNTGEDSEDASTSAAPRKTKGLPSKKPNNTDAPTSGPPKLINGKYKCNHNCRDPTICKHACCRDGLNKPPPKRKKNDDLTDDDTQAAKSKKPTAKRKSAKNIIGQAMDEDIGSSDISAFVKDSREARKAAAAFTSSGLGTSSLSQYTNATTLPDYDDDEELPDLYEAAKLPNKKRTNTARTDDGDDNNNDSQANKRKKKDNTSAAPPLKNAAKRHNLNKSPDGKQRKSEFIDELADASATESDESFDEFPLPPPLAQKKATIPAPKQRKKAYTPPPRQNKTPLFKPPSTESERDELMEELDELDDSKGRVEEDDDKAESKYGSENDPEPAGSEAEEDNMAWLDTVQEED